MSNFWKFLDFHFINCEAELDLRLTKNCVVPEISRKSRLAGNPLLREVIFQLNNTKLDVPVVTLSFNDNMKVLENKKQELKRTISWNKYRSKQPKNNNLDYLVDPTIRNINILFIFLFKNGDDDSTRDSFEKYYML